MSLLDYYKKSIYEHGYFMSIRDNENNVSHLNIADDVYFNDEMDYNICANYHCSYNWTEEDEAFLRVLGFETSDFEDYYG